MSFVCGSCGSTTERPSKDQIRDAIRDHKGGWWYWEHEYPDFSEFVPRMGLVEIVYACYDETDCAIVFKTAYGLFKLTGFHDSYSGCNWREGSFREVEEKTRASVYYD